ncbi:MAG: ABC transporter ATP-binding protein [Planctomycetota bacterium]
MKREDPSATLPRGTAGARAPLLALRGLCTYFRGETGVARAVDGVDLEILPRETVGLVGESGCGKSVTALSILRLVPDPPGFHAGGEIRFAGRDLLRLPAAEMRRIRGNEVAMIFQEPMTALNPVFAVGEQIAEAVRLHQGLSRREASARAARMLEQVGIPDPARRARSYPHQLSGGMRQRVMIAMAVSCGPRLLIADEPTTALDVTVQAQILALLADLQRRTGMSMLLITHDLGVVAETADRVAVMYAGRVVEHAGVRELFARPRHPYTVGLLRSRPDLARPGERLPAIEGAVPSAFALPAGCRFHPRCPRAAARCVAEEPALLPAPAAAGEHAVACHFPVAEEP